MSNSKPLPPFTFDVLRYFNRDQLEHFSIVCRPLKNLIDRYFHSKPYRVFEELRLYGGSYALIHKDVQWHPNRDDYSVQQFLDGQKCGGIDEPKRPWHGYECHKYYTFVEMRPYLGLTVRLEGTLIYVAEHSTYNPEQIEQMESIAYLWRDHKIWVINAGFDSRIVFEDFQPILNSPTILQCRILDIDNAHFSFKDYKVLYSVNVIKIWYDEEMFDPDSCPQFIEQPGVKPIVVLVGLNRESVDNVLGRLSKAFSSAVSPNAFKIVFAELHKELTEFKETNKNSAEILELKKGLPAEFQDENMEKFYKNYTLERSSI